MKKRSLGIAVLAAVSVVLAGCGSSSSGGTSTSTAAAGGGGTSKPTVANVINGPLGDQGFFDDANRGMEQLKSSGFKTQVIQSDANNPAQWPMLTPLKPCSIAVGSESYAVIRFL